MKAYCLEFHNPKIQCVMPATKEGRCKKHQLPAFAKNMRKDRLPEGWNYIRDEVFRRHGTVCYLCGEKGADSVEHVVPNDDNSFDNLRPAHQNVAPYCHRTKTAHEGHEAQRQAKPLAFGESWNKNRLPNNNDTPNPF